MSPTTTTTTSRPRTQCPDCGRSVSFVTDLVHKYLARHRRPDGRWCLARQIEFPPLEEVL
jgi:hypothetical protein